MSELNDFIKVANASERDCFNVSTIEPIESNNKNVVAPSLESFDSKHMNRAWRVCWGTTTLILVFLLFLWVYFEMADGFEGSTLHQDAQK